MTELVHNWMWFRKNDMAFDFIGGRNRFNRSRDRFNFVETCTEAKNYLKCNAVTGIMLNATDKRDEQMMIALAGNALFAPNIARILLISRAAPLRDLGDWVYWYCTWDSFEVYERYMDDVVNKCRGSGIANIHAI